MKEKKGLSRYRKQIVFLMDLVLANLVYFVLIYWVPIRNGTEMGQIIAWMPNFGLMLLCLCGFPNPMTACGDMPKPMNISR